MKKEGFNDLEELRINNRLRARKYAAKQNAVGEVTSLTWCAWS